MTTAPNPSETITLELCHHGLGRSEPRVVWTRTFSCPEELADFTRETNLYEGAELANGFFVRRAIDLLGNPY